MNKVFKVIWNEARNCYVVVSELAKNRGGKSCSTRKLLAMLIATGVMCCAPLMNGVEAAQPNVSVTNRDQYVSFLVSVGNNCTQQEYNSKTKKFGDYTYKILNLDGKEYWVREGYNLIIDPNGGKYTTLSSNAIRADVVRTGDEDSANGLLRSVTSAIGGTDIKTNLGETLQRIDAGTYAAVSLSGGTGVLSNYNYIIYDPERQGTVANGGYFDAGVGNLASNFVVAGESNSGLTWNEDLKQYEYNNGKTVETVDYSNMYVIEYNNNEKKLGIFIDSKGNLYKGTVYGKHNEILMTVKDGDNIYSYWAAKVTDPTQTMATFPVVEYQKNLDTLVGNDTALYHNDIKEVTLEKEVANGEEKNNSGEIKLWRNGLTLNADGTTSDKKVVDGTIKISSGGGINDEDTFVKVGIGSNELTLPTGSKVVGTEAAAADATKIKGITINGVNYEVGGSNYTAGSNITISDDGSISAADTNNYVTSGTYDKNSKNLTLNREGLDDITIGLADLDTNTTYTAGTGIKIEGDNNEISVDTSAVNLAYRANSSETSKSVSLSQGLNFVNGTNTTVTVGDNGMVQINATDTNNYVTSGTYNSETKRIDFTNSDLNKNFSVDLSGITSGLSTIDYALVANPTDGSDGKYKADSNGALTLKVKDRNGSETYNVVIEDVASAKKVAENTTNISNLDNRVSTNTTNISNLDSRVSTNTTNISNLDNRVSTNTTNISNLDSRVSTNTTNISSNTTYINSLKEGLFKVSDGTNTATIKHENTVKIVGGGAASVTVDESSKTVTISATDTTYNAGENITIDITNDNKINLKNNISLSTKVNNVGGTLTINAGDSGKISGLTAGDITDTSTDAVNGSQLHEVKQTAEKGWNLTTTNGNTTSTARNIAPDATVDFTGDSNITVSDVTQANETGAKLKVALSRNLDVDTVTAGNTVMNSSGLTINGKDSDGKDIIIAGLTSGSLTVGGKTYITGSGLNANGQKITNVADGEADTDAVNYGQLKEYVSGNTSDTTYTAGKNISINGTNNEIALKNTISFYVKDKNGDVKYDVLKINAGDSGKISGLTAGDITDTSTDAVNGSQLNEVKQTAEKGWNLTTSGSNSKKVAPGDAVDFTSADENVVITNLDENGNPSTNVKFKLNSALTGINSISNGTGDNAVKISLSKETGSVEINGVTVTKGNKITGVAAGEISDTSTDAVNGSQLDKAIKESKTSVSAGSNIEVTHEEDETDGHMDYKVKLSDNINVTSVTAGNTSISNDGLTIKDKDDVVVSLKNDGLTIGNTKYVSSAGLNAGSKSITNVADGVADSDAVNVSQLRGVAAEAAKHTTVSEDEKGNIKITPETKDGQTDYKVSLNEDINITSVTLGSKGTVLNEDGLTVGGASGSVLGSSSLTIGGANGLALTSSSLSIGGRTYITGNGLNANGQKITNVADGEISDTSTDAVNGSQLKSYVEGYVTANDKDTHIDSSKEYKVDEDNKVKMDVVDKNGKSTGEQITITDVAKASEVGKLEDVHDGIKGDTIVGSINKLDDKVGDLQYNNVAKGDIVDGDSTTTAIGKLNKQLSEVAEEAGKHTTVTAGSNITVTKDTTENNYTVGLDSNLKKIESISNGDSKITLNNDNLAISNDNKQFTITESGMGMSVINKTDYSTKSIMVTENGTTISGGLDVAGSKITNVADGEVSATSKDAVNGSQLHATNSRIDETNQQVMNNTQNISKLGSRLNKVGAGAAALAALHPMDFDPDDKLTFAAGVGNYGGENAAAIGAYYRPDEKVMFSVGGTMGNGENMVNAGISFALDRTNHVSNSRTAMAREIVDLRAEINELKAMLAKGGLGSIDEDKMKIFPDVAENHWAYEYVGKLAAAGIVEGFPNGEFDGDRMMSRYEFAAMLYRAMQNGAQLDSRIINEFAPEMGRIRVDRISGADNDKRKIERVRVNGTDKAKNDYRDHYGSKIAK